MPSWYRASAVGLESERGSEPKKSATAPVMSPIFGNFGPSPVGEPQPFRTETARSPQKASFSISH